MFKRIYIEITNNCNLNCEFCKKDYRKKSYMKIEDYKKIIDKIKNYTNHIYLHIKGEPLMHPDLCEIIKYTNDSNVFVNITTNGRLIENNIDILNNIRQLNISLHSYTDDSVLKVLDSIKKIKNPYISLRLWKKSKSIEKIIKEYFNLNELKDKTKIKDNIYLSIEEEFIWPDINAKIISEKGTCLALKDQIGILVDGSVVICCLDQDNNTNIGNIFNENLCDILKKPRCKSIVENFNNNTLIEPLCKRCGFINRNKNNV